MTATEFQRRRCKPALREGMAFPVFQSLDAQAGVAGVRRTDEARRLARTEAWLKQQGGACNTGPA